MKTAASRRRPSPALVRGVRGARCGLAEIEGLDIGALPKLHGGTLENRDAVLQNGRAVRIAERHSGVLFGDKDRETLLDVQRLQRAEYRSARPAARAPSTARRERVAAAATSGLDQWRSSAARRRRSDRPMSSVSPSSAENSRRCARDPLRCRPDARSCRDLRRSDSLRPSASGSSAVPPSTCTSPARTSSDVGVRVTSSPSKTMRPAVICPRSAGSRFETAFRVVVLPAPFAPSKARISPLRSVERNAMERDNRVIVVRFDVFDDEQRRIRGHGLAPDQLAREPVERPAPAATRQLVMPAASTAVRSLMLCSAA